MEQIEGITLSVSHYKDKDAILNILTKNGVVVVLGRGIFDQKKPLRVFTSPFLHARFEVYKGKVGGFKLKDGQILKFYNENYLDFNLLGALDFISELTLKVIDGIDDYSSLYNYLKETLDKLSIKFDKAYLAKYFLIILRLLGLKIRTGSLDEHLFNPANGSFTKEEDPDAIYFNFDEIIFIDSILNDKDVDYDIENIDFDKILNILNIFLTNFTDVRLKSISILL